MARMKLLVTYLVLASLALGGGAIENQYPRPLLFLSFNGHSRDASGRNINPVHHGTEKYITGPLGEANGALEFSGNYLEWENGVEGPLDFGGAASYTAIFWILNHASSIGALLTYFTANPLSLGLEFWEYPAEETFFVRHGSNNHVLANAMAVGQWTQLVYTYDSTTGLNIIYKNGVEAWRDTVVQTYDTDKEKVHFGKRNSHDSPFHGALACLQLYDSYLTYGEINRVLSLCTPEYTGLQPWPRPLGVWPFNERYSGRDMKSGDRVNNAQGYGTTVSIDSYPSGSGSYQVYGSSSSYIDIDNSNRHLSLLNSFTFSLWLYQTDTNTQYPLFQYEFGTEKNGVNGWGLHLWALNGLFFRNSPSITAGNKGSWTIHQWHFLAMSFDFATDLARFVIDDDEFTQTVVNSALQMSTNLSDGVRIGTTFFAGENRRMSAKISCVQLYDLPMTFEQMKGLSNVCHHIEERDDGVPSNLVLMYPFDEESLCNDSLYNALCVLSTSGPRERKSEGLHLKRSEIASGGTVYLKPKEGSVEFNHNSFSLLMYIKLDAINDMAAKIGFLAGNGSESNTWISLNTSGHVDFSASGMSSADDDIFRVDSVYNQSEVEWIHVAVICNSFSFRCYIYRNSTFVGESVENNQAGWFVSNELFIELGSETAMVEVEIGCLQLYSRALSQKEIITSKDRCSRKGDLTRAPLPVGFWPLDNLYKGQELTGRSKPLTLMDNVTFHEDSPFNNTQGSLHVPKYSSAVIPACSGTDVRHSFTLQTYIKAENVNSTIPYFVYADRNGLLGPGMYITENSSLLTNLVALDDKTVLQTTPYVSNISIADVWTRVAVTFDYSTATLKHYIGGELIDERRLKDGYELFTTLDVHIGNLPDSDGQAEFSLTCLQLYDVVLSLAQLDSAAQLCQYQQESAGSYFEKPDQLERGWTFSQPNQMYTSRNRLDCFQRCLDSSYCLSINYFQSNRECQLIGQHFTNLELSLFEQTGGLYMELVDPLSMLLAGI